VGSTCASMCTSTSAGSKPAAVNRSSQPSPLHGTNRTVAVRAGSSADGDSGIHAEHPLSTYFVTLVAGPYASTHDTYVTDDVKLTPRLTMNIGVRYEFNSAITDIGGQSRNFDFTKLELYPAPLTKGALNDPSKKLFAPRLGFAWRPFGGNNTVIRTGYGVFFNVNMMNMFVPALAANPPNNLNINQLNSAGAVVIRMRTADQASALNINSEINSADTKKGVGDVQQWNFNIQRMLPKAVLVEVGFINNPDEEKLMADGEYQSKIAGAIFRSIQKFENREQPAKPSASGQ